MFKANWIFNSEYKIICINSFGVAIDFRVHAVQTVRVDLLNPFKCKITHCLLLVFIFKLRNVGIWPFYQLFLFFNHSDRMGTLFLQLKSAFVVIFDKVCFVVTRLWSHLLHVAMKFMLQMLNCKFYQLFSFILVVNDQWKTLFKWLQ